MVEIKEVRIDEIIVEDRVRKVNGITEMDSLERSIMSLGLLQPIAITPKKKLIFGGRRLKACKRIGMETIPARIIDVDDPTVLLRMEKHENEYRLPFTPSEKIEIARRIEESLAGRWGSNQHHTKVDPQNFAGPQKGESRDIAAKAVDMNRETYRQAKAVVDSGDREVIERMDKGELSIHGAYEQVKRKKAKGRKEATLNNGETLTENFPEARKGETRDKVTEPTQRTFKITLVNDPSGDAKTILERGGKDYGVQLAIALLKAAGHKVDVE